MEAYLAVKTLVLLLVKYTQTNSDIQICGIKNVILYTKEQNITE